MLHIIGESSETGGLEKRTKELELSHCVTFHSELQKADIEKLYNQYTITLEDSSYLRREIVLLPSIKSREYFAKRMQFSYRADIDVFLEEPCELCLRLTAEDRPLDFEQIVRLHESPNRANNKKRSSKIRNYAARHIL